MMVKSMTVKSMMVKCECGRRFVLRETSTQQAIHCHLCGRTIDLENWRRERAELERGRELANAVKVRYAGLQFGGLYCTPKRSPIVLDAHAADGVHLTLRFRPDLSVEYHCKQLRPRDVSAAASIVGEFSDAVRYELIGATRVRFLIQTGHFNFEMEGVPRPGYLILAYRIEELVMGVSHIGGSKSINEGDCELEFIELDQPNLGTSNSL